MVLGVVVYCTVFAAVYALALVWILERREKKYRQGSISFTNSFLVGSFLLIFVYFSNIVVLLRWTDSAFLYDIVLVTALAGFGTYRETVYKAGALESGRRLRAEVRLLELSIENDGTNAACFERLSEIYEKLGEKEKALATARKAAELDPAVRNTWRVRQLEES